jgi:hypothetical protein
LRRFFVKRGIALSAVAIAGAVSAHSVQAAPAALTKSVTAIAITKGAMASGSTLTLIKGALKIMAWTKAKTAVVVGIAAILAVGTTTIVVCHNPGPFIDFILLSDIKEVSSDEDVRYASYAGTTPGQAAKTFFEACAQENWTEVTKFHLRALDDKFKKTYAGLQVLSLGKPFRASTRSGQRYGGAFVPYEIRLKNGHVRKFQLHVECDRHDKTWHVNGGL